MSWQTKIPKFRRFVIQNFPFIEEDFDALTDYQLISKIVEYLNNVINSQNQVIDQVTVLTDAINELTSYVDHYFDNLDVQEEINNKIDKMVSDGTFQIILNSYIQPELDNLNTKIDNEIDNREQADLTLQNIIDAVGNGSPLVASSTDDMTDTTKTYVNTTDGKWYYYDGTTWIAGGTYQSTGIGENTIEPYMTKFLETHNLMPYTNWVEGYIYSNGNETAYANGCLNRSAIPVTGGHTLVSINSSLLPYTDFSVTEYAEDDSYITTTRMGYTLNKRLVLNENTAYIKFSSITNKLTTLPINSLMIVDLVDLDKMLSYNSVFEFNKANRQTIKADEIFIENDYKFRIVPQIYATGIQLGVTNLNFPTPYKVEYTNTVTGSGTQTVSVGTFLYAENVTTNDYLYVDFRDGTLLPTYVNSFKAQGGTTTGYLDKVEDGLFRIKITQDIIDGLNAGSMLVFGIFYDQTSGSDITVKFHCYINEDFTDFVKLIKSEETENPIKFIFMGDSITHLSGDRGWTTHFNSFVNGYTIANTAVDGAVLKDYPTTVYNGTPSSADQANNVLGNQVQKIINNNYEDPDVIMIAIGTNGGINIEGTELQDAFFTTNGVKPITDVNRQTDAGAYRYCTEKLHDLYPNAKIIWCTPILGNYANNKRPNTVGVWGDNLKTLCSWGSAYCFDTEKCGINNINYAEYLQDGIHPNEAGANIMAEYNASEFYKIKTTIKNRN